MKIVVNDQVCLSEFRSSDKPALLQHLNDPDIYHRTLRIPFPYTEASADEWLTLVTKITEQQGRQVQWAIRTAADALIGGCGGASTASRSASPTGPRSATGWRSRIGAGAS